MKVIAITKKGIEKAENEDRIIVGKSIISEGSFSVELNDGILAIADGVGGNNAGAIASHFVATRLSIQNDVTDETLKMINDDLIQLSLKESAYRKMATTLSGVLLSQDKPRLFYIGNTRVFSLQGGKYLKQLTNDDTTINYLIATGQLTIQDAENFDKKNEITACFGGGTTELFRIKISSIEINNSPIIITSDGIHDYLSVDRIEEIIEQHGLTKVACNKIIDEARYCGSKDDTSILLGGI